MAALHPTGRRGKLAELLGRAELLGPIDPAAAADRFADYLLDPAARGMPVGDEAGAAWLAGSPLLERLAPGWAAPIDDDLAAVAAAGLLLDGEKLSQRAIAGRFAPRADAALAAAIGRLPPQRAAKVARELEGAPGPDEERLHIALTQAGLALSWADAAALAEPEAVEIVERLLGLFQSGTPEPLLDRIGQALGPIAATVTPIGEKVRAHAVALVERTVGKVERPRATAGGSFLEEFRALDAPRAIPDEDRWKGEADRRAAGAAVRLLGRAAPDDPAAFQALRRLVVDGREDPRLLLPSFLDGLCDGVVAGPLAELVAVLLAEGTEGEQELGLVVAGRVPLDACADAILAKLEGGSPAIRRHAVRAAALLLPERAVPALTARLDDAAPEVCAAAASALAEHGRTDLLLRTMPPGKAVGAAAMRVAAVRAALPDCSPQVVAWCLNAIEAESKKEGWDPGESPLVASIGAALRASPEGLARVGEMVEAVRDTLTLLALVLTAFGRDGLGPAVSLSEQDRAPLDEALLPIVEEAVEDAGLALALLCRFAAGDARLVPGVAWAIDKGVGDAATMLSALGDLRVRSEQAAAAIAPLLEDGEHLGARLAAAAVAGVALPVDHPAWQRVEELLPLGAVGAAAAWAALYHRARLASL